ncbi:MAG: ATP-binding cassette domain-containing protein [Firmicutes bacterium]|nr:ATP-binding cassette domain-containing protein [Bacillota bacterium]
MKIILKDICKSYEDKVIFDKFNLTVEKGEMLAITGISGSGKTTLLHIIGLLEKPDSGDVVVDDIPNKYKEKTKIRLYRNVYSFLFQNYALIANMTVSENLDIALKYVEKNLRKNLKQNALNKLALLDKQNQKIFKLSGGEQQRVALARIMVKPNTIVLADEPTGALDPLNRDLILEILKKLSTDGKTILMVTHDPIVANCCSRVINL